MAHGFSVDTANARKLLVERVAASRYINRSARLRDLLVYLSDRVLEDEAAEIHEQEVGHRVFGRPANYDTTSDNIVRVHASMLRKRLDQYFAAEGADEPVILEIPKGNYAPVFRERPEPAVAPSPVLLESVPSIVAPAAPVSKDRKVPILAAICVILACSTAWLLATRPAPVATSRALTPAVRAFWSRIFQPGRPTDLVLDDAAVGQYQELTGKTLSSSEYSDKSYLPSLASTAASANLDQRVASLFRKRHSSFADTSFLWKLWSVPGANPGQAVLRFARDYSFHDLRADNAVLLGNSRSNLWVEAFESKTGLRWQFDEAGAYYYPVDSWNNGKAYRSDVSGDTHEGYCGIALLPNLGGTGSVLTIAGTGGSSINGGADFLLDESSLAELRRRLTSPAGSPFPYFEALIRVEGRSATPRNLSIVLCRRPKT
jgi:hypothetical protein